MKAEKKINAVKMMREIRDNLSAEFSKMSYEEQKKYIKKNKLRIKNIKKDYAV